MSSAGGTGTVALDAQARKTLGQLVASHARRQGWWPDSHDEDVEVLSVWRWVDGRPGLVDVVVESGTLSAHLVLGLRVPGDESHFLVDDEDVVVGLFEDAYGLAVAFDAMCDGELAVMLLEVVTDGRSSAVHSRPVRRDAAGSCLVFDDRVMLTSFSTPRQVPDPAIKLIVDLDEAGFNHIPAPLGLWRRDGMELGFAQEVLVGASVGWALALTSLRDLYASGCRPEDAGGDFASEARALGTMTARMHLALDRAYGRGHCGTAVWVDAVEAELAMAGGGLLGRPEVVKVLADARRLPSRCPIIRTHGDYHLGRVARTEQGWFVSELLPALLPAPGQAGEMPPGSEARPALAARCVEEPGRMPMCSPLADVADMLWSFRHVATVAAEERDPLGREGLSVMGDAWQQRNRRAFLSGYLRVSGIAGLLPPDRKTVRSLAAMFELQRAAARMAASSTLPDR